MSVNQNNNHIQAGVFHSPHNKIDLMFKVILIGQSGVGKSSILNQFVDKEFNENYMSTIGVDFRLKTIKTNKGKTVKLQIWDTAGQERFAALTNSHYKGAHSCICVYDITNSKSFTTAETYLQTAIQQHGLDPELIYLVGNKVDQSPDQRKLTQNQGKELSQQYGVNFLETSAKNYENVELLFQQMIDHLIEIVSNPSMSKKLSHLNTVKVTAENILDNDFHNRNGQNNKQNGCCS